MKAMSLLMLYISSGIYLVLEGALDKDMVVPHFVFGSYVPK